MMTGAAMRLQLLEGSFSVSRFAPDARLPDTVWVGDFCAVTRTREETSVVTSEKAAPAGAERTESGWRCLKVKGPLDFGMVGVLSAMADPLAKAGISIFVISTFDTDYLLVKEESLDGAIYVLRGAGFRFD